MRFTGALYVESTLNRRAVWVVDCGGAGVFHSSETHTYMSGSESVNKGFYAWYINQTKCMLVGEPLGGASNFHRKGQVL